VREGEIQGNRAEPRERAIAEPCADEPEVRGQCWNLRVEIRDARDRRTAPSENPPGRILYCAAQKKVQAIARRNIDRNSEAPLEQLLDADQINKRKSAAGVIIDKQVEIALTQTLHSAPSSRKFQE
jgi:hypothetical protein